MEVLEIKKYNNWNFLKNSIGGLNSRMDYTEKESVNLKIEQ